MFHLGGADKALVFDQGRTQAKEVVDGSDKSSHKECCCMVTSVCELR